MGSRLAMAGICHVLTSNQIWFTMVFGSTMVIYDGFWQKPSIYQGVLSPCTKQLHWRYLTTSLTSKSSHRNGVLAYKSILLWTFKLNFIKQIVIDFYLFIYYYHYLISSKNSNSASLTYLQCYVYINDLVSDIICMQFTVLAMQKWTPEVSSNTLHGITRTLHANYYHHQTKCIKSTNAIYCHNSTEWCLQSFFLVQDRVKVLRQKAAARSYWWV